MEDKKFVNVLFSNKEVKKLDQIAHEAGRSRGAVIKRLVVLAGTPEGKRLLGTDQGIDPGQPGESEGDDES